jgi:DNA-binding transcriptional ArsR family regulator
MSHSSAQPTGIPLTGARLLRAAELIRLLGHPLRLRLAEGLDDGERTVSALQAYTGAPQAQVSQQLAALRGHGIVTCRREGAFVYYRLLEPRVHAMLRCLHACDAADPPGPHASR